MEVPAKVINSNVLANRNVNVPKSSVVTKSPLTFSNKLERPQKSQINNFFPVSSKGKSDFISPAGNCAPASCTPSAVSAIKVTTVATKSDNQFTSGTRGNSSLNASLGFPMDDWDDFDDFETPVKAKNDSFSLEISGKSTNPVSSPTEEKTQFTGKLNHDASLMTPELSNSFANKNGLSRSEQSRMETDEVEHSVDEAAVSPGPSVNQDPVEGELEDSPVKMTRRRPPAHSKSVMSDSEEDNDVVLEPFKGMAGNKLFVAAFVFYLYIIGQMWVWKALNYTTKHLLSLPFR